MASKRKQRREAKRKAQRSQTDRKHVKTQKPLYQRDDRSQLIAMTLASLVAGLLAIVNLDRAAHVDSLTKEERLLSTSRHGWPLVYLERQVKKTPEFYFGKRVYSWPWPAVTGEQRRWNFGNLIGNIGIGLAIVAAAYALICFIVRRYDRWKKNLT